MTQNRPETQAGEGALCPSGPNRVQLRRRAPCSGMYCLVIHTVQRLSAAFGDYREISGLDGLSADKKANHAFYCAA